MAGPYTPPNLRDTPVPDLFTLVAERNPQRPFVQIIREYVGAPTDSIIYTWAEVIQHAQNAAASLRERWNAHPREPGSPPLVVGVMAHNGYQLYVNVLACILNRWTALLISSRNSPAGVEHLLRISNSKLFLVDVNNMVFGKTMEQAIPGIKAEAISSLDTPNTGPAASPLTVLTEDQLRNEMQLPAFYLHTSGSTGHPKIVPWSHEFVLCGARTRRKDDEEFIGVPYYCMPPLIHVMGVAIYFMYAVAHANLMTFVSSPTPSPPSAAALLAHLPFVKGGIVLLPPSILEDIHSLGPEAIRQLVEGTLFVVFGGAPLNLAVGQDLVAAGLRFTSGWGATEINIGSAQTRKEKSPEDWEYMSFREGYTWHFLPVDDHSNLREIVVGPGWDGCPAVFNHENPRGYATHDIWEPHPTVPNLWKHHRRKGDVTVLSNGEKSDNKQIEDLLLRDKRILYVQVFGTGRFMNGVILQPVDPSVPPSEFISQITPTLAYANSILPRHSRLVPELIIVATADRPFATTDKRTVKKKDTIDRFEQEIERAYKALEEGGTGSEWPFEGEVDDENAVKKFMQQAVQTVLGETVPDKGDFFDHGFDSLLAIRLRAAVVSVIKKTLTASQSVPRNIVYMFPNVIDLTSYIISRAASGACCIKDSREERIRQSIAKYSAHIVPHKPGCKAVEGHIVALSGSTGSLGSSLLGLLLERVDVKKIYLLNRKGNESLQKRQARALVERGINPDILVANECRIIYLDVDFSRADLGLAIKDYEDLRDNVTHIIHTAWHLNFNFILESFERIHIAGVRHLVDLALSSPHAQPPRLTFLSTISAAGMYRGPTQEPSVGERAGQTLVPETPIDDSTVVLDQGYGQAKYVSERVLVNAVQAGMRATIVRIGQLSGVTTTGAWAASEHVPILIRSSCAMGIVPEDLPPVRWVPSNVAATAIMKHAFEDSSALNYFSVENPFPTPWNIISQAISAASPRPLRPVTLAAWLDHIKTFNPDPREVPAVKLMDYYQKLLHGGSATALGWEKSLRVAPELAVGPISAELVEKYVLYQQ